MGNALLRSLGAVPGMPRTGDRRSTWAPNRCRISRGQGRLLEWAALSDCRATTLITTASESHSRSRKPPNFPSSLCASTSPNSIRVCPVHGAADDQQPPKSLISSGLTTTALAIRRGCLTDNPQRPLNQR